MNPSMCCHSLNQIPKVKPQSIIVLAMLIGLAAVAKAEDSGSQVPSPTPGGSQMEEPALPTPEPGPSSAVPDLLPESGELPAQVPPKLSSGAVSTRHSSEEEGRFDEIRSLAMKNPRAAYLLKRAKSSSNSASRRSYLRAYYVAVASRMRKLDPDLASSISAYEEAKIHEVSATGNSAARVSHRSRLRHTANRERHHRSHRISSEYRYRRMIIIDDPYGPYGPEIPPYGPPMVFDPW
jgi:hypothetical protein